MHHISLHIQIPPFSPVLKRQNGYYKASPVIQTTSEMETPEWPTGDESYYDTHHTAYTWDDIQFTLAEIRQAAANQAEQRELRKAMQHA